jgi:hypothetical protein
MTDTSASIHRMQARSGASPAAPEVVGANLVELEVPVNLRLPLPHSRVASIRPPALIEGRVLRPDLDLRIGVLDPIVDVAAIPPLKRLAYHLDVLLRHRLLLKPGGFEGLPDLEVAPRTYNLAARMPETASRSPVVRGNPDSPARAAGWLRGVLA